MKFALDTGVLVASVKSRDEKFNVPAMRLVSILREQGHDVVFSALAIEELRGALASSTSMPSEKIFEVERSLEEALKPVIVSCDKYIEKTCELLLSFRDLKRKKRMPSADFHHLASAIGERADFFVTVDQKHLLAPETKEAMAGLIRILDPEEALSSTLRPE